MTISEGFFVAAFGVSVWIRAEGERRGGETRELQRLHQVGDAVLIGGMAVGAVILPAVHLTTRWLAFADYPLPVLFTLVGGLLASLALWLLHRAHVDLGANWSRVIAVKAGHVLVMHGVYRHVRHPMYVAIAMFCLAQGLLVHNAIAGWSGLGAFAPMLLYRVPREERLLRTLFGADYLAYCRTTPRYWPRWRAPGS